MIRGRTSIMDTAGKDKRMKIATIMEENMASDRHLRNLGTDRRFLAVKIVLLLLLLLFVTSPQSFITSPQSFHGNVSINKINHFTDRKTNFRKYKNYMRSNCGNIWSIDTFEEHLSYIAAVGKRHHKTCPIECTN